MRSGPPPLPNAKNAARASVYTYIPPSHLRLLERKSPKIAQNNLKKSHEPTQNSTPAAIFSDAKNNERMKVKSAKLDEKAMESGPVVYVFECTEPCKPVVDVWDA
eukprot:564306-Amorphochlora_amoeboformis.AAC.1